MKRILCIFVLLALLLTGCGPRDVTIDDSAFLPGTTAMLDAILAEDFAGCRAVMTEQVDDESLRGALDQMGQLLEGVESYTLKPVGWRKNVTNGISQSTVRYEMQTNLQTYYVDAVLVEGMDGLAGFHITPIQQNTVTGTPANMQGASLMQWLVLLIGVAEWAFVVWMAVDCLRRKPKRKIGWLLLILLVSGIFTLTVAAGKVSFNINAGIYLHLSGLLSDSAGSMMLKLYIPIGAIVYWFRRKKLNGPTVGEPAVPQEEISPEIQENPENA